MSDAMPVTPASVQVPADYSAPISLDFSVHALRLALIDRWPVAALPDLWARPGVYVLLGYTNDGPMEVYVGQAVRLRDRLRQHRRQPPIDWWRAVAVVRDTSNGFNSAEIGYLEGRLAAELRARPRIALRAGKKDIDETLPDHLLISLDALIPTILAGLRIAGAPTYTDEPGEPTAHRQRGTPQRIEGTVADLLAAGLLAAGARLVLTRAGRSATAVVSASGSLLVDGVAYDSPSMAGKTALGLKSINGWTAWHLEERPDVSLSQLRAQLDLPAN